MDLDKKARDLQDEVRNIEIREPRDYEDEAVRQAMVHAREELVLVASYLSSVAKLLVSIKRSALN